MEGTVKRKEEENRAVPRPERVSAGQKMLPAFLLLFFLLFVVRASCSDRVIASSGRRGVEMVTQIINPDVDGSLEKLLKLHFDADPASHSFGSLTYGEDQTLEGLGFLGTVYQYCETIAMMLLCAAFCISLMQGYIEGTNYEEILVKRFIVLGLTIMCIYGAQPVCMGLANIGSEIVTAVHSANGGVDAGENAESGDSQEAQTTAGDAVYEDDDCTQRFSYIPADYSSEKFSWLSEYQQEIIDKSSYSVDNFLDITTTFKRMKNEIEGFYYCVVLFFPWVISKGAAVIIKAVCWGRMIELLLLIAFAPFAFLSFRGTGALENIIRFLRQYAAVILQGGIILASCYIASAVRANVLTEAFGKGIGNFNAAMVDMIVISVVQAGIIGRSRQISQTVCGN